MNNIKVSFWGQDGKHLKFDAIFKSENTLDKFVESYKYWGEFNRFEFDIVEDNCQEKLPILTNSNKSFILVYNNLYQQ
jgi:hypothetical protein